MKQHAAQIARTEKDIERLQKEIKELEEELRSTGSVKTTDEVQVELDILDGEMLVFYRCCSGLQLE